jgi:DNA-binding MarR family transcriptional regulator
VPEGLTGPQYAVLTVLAAFPGSDQKQIARRASLDCELAALDSSTTTAIVNRLVARGYLTRTKDPADGRGRILTLTRDAVTQLQDVHPRVELVQQRLLDPLSPLDRENFLHDLARVAFEGDLPGAAA